MSANQQVIAAEPNVVISTATSLLQVIERAASNPHADIDKMERMMQLYERVVAREAEAAFNAALADCQKEIRMVPADADNPQTHSKYATYAKLDRFLRPIYSARDISISYDTDASPKEDHIRILAYVSRGGHTRTYKVDMPADGKGAKGGDVMTKTHAAGAAMSYGMRYLLKCIFNVAVGEEDVDGNTHAGMPDAEYAEWVKKIEATTTKAAAKEVWAEAVKAIKAYEDVPASKSIKEVLIAHGEFIDKAGK